MCKICGHERKKKHPGKHCWKMSKNWINRDIPTTLINWKILYCLVSQKQSIYIYIYIQHNYNKNPSRIFFCCLHGQVGFKSHEKGKEFLYTKQFWSMTKLEESFYLIKASVIRVWYWQKYRWIDQCDRIEFRNRPIQIWPADFWQSIKAMMLI